MVQDAVHGLAVVCVELMVEEAIEKVVEGGRVSDVVDSTFAVVVSPCVKQATMLKILFKDLKKTY